MASRSYFRGWQRARMDQERKLLELLQRSKSMPREVITKGREFSNERKFAFTLSKLPRGIFSKNLTSIRQCGGQRRLESKSLFFPFLQWNPQSQTPTQNVEGAATKTRRMKSRRSNKTSSNTGADWYSNSRCRSRKINEEEGFETHWTSQSNES